MTQDFLFADSHAGPHTMNKFTTQCFVVVAAVYAHVVKLLFRRVSLSSFTLFCFRCSASFVAVAADVCSLR